MKTKKEILALGLVLLMTSCTTDDLQFQEKEVSLIMENESTILMKDSISNAGNTVVNDSISIIQYEPPVVRPKKP